MILPIFIPMNVAEDVFDKKPSDKASYFYKNYSTVSLMLLVLKEMNSATFSEILAQCSNESVDADIEKIDAVKTDSYKFNKATKEVTGLDYGSISKLYKKWPFYSYIDKKILVKCARWETTINKMDL